MRGTKRQMITSSLPRPGDNEYIVWPKVVFSPSEVILVCEPITVSHQNVLEGNKQVAMCSAVHSRLRGTGRETTNQRSIDGFRIA